MSCHSKKQCHIINNFNTNLTFSGPHWGMWALGRFCTDLAALRSVPPRPWVKIPLYGARTRLVRGYWASASRSPNPTFFCIDTQCLYQGLLFDLYHVYLLLYIGVTSSILIGYKHAANSCLLCFSYVIPTNNRFYICRIDVIPTDNSFMHAEVTSRNTLTSSFISFVMAELSSGICIIKQLLNSVFAC